MPATAAIARTAVSVRAGASSKLAALTHAVVLLGFMALLAPVVSEIPVAALAGVLLATTVRMVEVGSLRSLARATRGDAVVLIGTFVITIVFDLVTAVGIGVGLALIVTVRQMAQSAGLEREPLDRGDHSDEEHQLLSQHIVAYRFDGPLFFAASHRFLMEITEVSDVRAVILRMSQVSGLDATGATVLDEAIRRLEARGIIVLLSGITPEHDQILDRVGVAAQLRADGLILPTTPDAIAAARRMLAGDLARVPSEHVRSDQPV